MGAIDLDAAERKADSLKRYAEANGMDNLTDFAATTRVLVAELRTKRGGLEWLYAYLMDEDALEPPEVALPRITRKVYELTYGQDQGGS